MNLVRVLFFIAAENHFEFTAEHLSGVNNECADSLSRGQLEIFRHLNPSANPKPDMPALIPLEL